MAQPVRAPHPGDAIAKALADLRAQVIRQRADLLESVPKPGGLADTRAAGLSLGRRNAAILDGLLTRLFALLRDAGGKPWPTVALAGVGGYGRGAVALGSDLDLRLLARDTGAASAVADALLYPLWDTGIAIGHQIVTIDELERAARDDLPTATSLLDWRHVTGDRSLSEALQRRGARGLFAHSELPRFLGRLGDEVAQRHARFGGSVYLLEPDVKNGQGGLRDLDVAGWAARARYGVSDPGELVRVGALVAREALELERAAELLWSVRNLLHAHAGRRSDRLTFDEQEAIAPLLGYGAGADGVEQMMSDYYRCARAITRGLDMILARSTPVLGRRRPRDEDLGSGVRLFDGAVTLGDTELLHADPALALRLVGAAVERGAPLLAWARDAIVRSCSDPLWCAELRRSPEAARRFVELVSTCKETRLKSGTVIRELHDLGLLLAMIPEFGPVVGRVHHDVYHVYTVDVHSVAAVDRLAALVRGELAALHPLACRVAAEVPRPAMLFFATLLHDVGKAIGGREHSQRGAEMAREILGRLGFAPEDVAEACHLVHEHLVMYHVATRRDLDDPAAIADFVRSVHGREGLRDLYLLTVADLSTTSPTSMTSWKARMLDELFVAADAALGGGASDDGRALAIEAEVGRALEALPCEPETEREARRAFLPGYLRSMPERYLLANAPSAIAAHAEVARGHGGDTPHPGHGVAPVGTPHTPVSVALVPSRHPEAAEICVVAADRPGLLAAITAALAASRLEVHAAQIHSRATGSADGALQAVDLFWVRDRGEGASAVTRALPKLVRDIGAVLAGQGTAAELARQRGTGAAGRRRAPKVPTRISLDDRASPRHTVIEVLTQDRPGLLFAVSDTLHGLGLSIAVAKINTEGTRVVDVFYVGEADGSKVAPGARANEVQARLQEAVEALSRTDTDGRQELEGSRR